MTDKLTQIEKRFQEVEESLSDAGVISDMERYKALMKEYKELTPITEAFRAYKKSVSDLEEAQLLLKEEDSELKELAEGQTPINGKIHLLVKDYSLQAQCHKEKERLNLNGFEIGEENFYYPDHSSEDVLLNVFYTP